MYINTKSDDVIAAAMGFERKSNWGQEETPTLVELVEERKHFIRVKFSPTLSSADKKQVWEHMSRILTASHVACIHVSLTI